MNADTSDTNRYIADRPSLKDYLALGYKLKQAEPHWQLYDKTGALYAMVDRAMAEAFVEYETGLLKLLAYIRGNGSYAFFGQGITSYLDQIPLHAACLDLEARGLIRRHKEEGIWVLWMPK